MTNLFVGHNRMHDFAYYLGFTEDNYNLQADNFGTTGGRPAASDPELGNVQAGAVTGGAPSYEGRDNANQIALQDGIPGITNQYLFQPIAGAFYSPCADGDFDMSRRSATSTPTLITNRMVGGPDDGPHRRPGRRDGRELVRPGRARVPARATATPTGGENPWVDGPYVTGNKQRGIRDYALNTNPLNYSDIGFDVTGAGGARRRRGLERGQLRRPPGAGQQVQRAPIPVEHGAAAALRRRAGASSPTPSRSARATGAGSSWSSTRFLLQQGATSMLDARDAYLAADLMRFGGANQAAICGRRFAERGMGQ